MFPTQELALPPPTTPNRSLLMHFWPLELRRLLSQDCGITDGQPTPDFQPLCTGMLVQMCVGAFLGATGVAVIIAGWDDLSSDLGGSIAPIGVMLIGFCILIAWSAGFA